MRKGILKQPRYRPFSIERAFEPSASRDLALSAEQARELVEDEIGFLHDTHAGVTYSIFERAKHQQFCDRILAKLDTGMPVASLSNREAGFLLTSSPP